MKTASASSELLSHTGPDEVVVEKIRWSLRQRLRKQLHQLNTEFFDEVDDFFFSSSKQGQQDEVNLYLKAMRELRCKQTLYEESFLTDVLLHIKYSESSSENPGIEASPAGGFERVEIDLAFRAMRRKADRAYSEQLKKIETLNEELTAISNTEVVSGLSLIEAVLKAFTHAQACLNLPLDIRLVFIKLFEQHFLLRMERLLSDISSILSNADNPQFVEKLYSSSSAFGKRIKAGHSAKTLSTQRTMMNNTLTTAVPEDVEAEVSELVSQLCDSHRMPIFIERMLRTQWRAVLNVVGLNMGCFSAEWNEAKYCALMLAAATAEGAVIEAEEKSVILTQLTQGFDLVRLEGAVRTSFFAQLNQLFGETSGTNGSNKQISPSVERSNSETSISPSGKRVLSHDDLNELTKLMGGSEEPQDETPSHEDDLLSCFARVDKITVKRKGSYRRGNLQRPCLLIPQQSGGFEIRLDEESSSIKLSRLGLAMSLKFGDLLLESDHGLESFAESSVTIDNRRLH